MECINPRYLVDRDIEVPCGKCGFCCATKRSDWSFRLEYELRRYDDSSFVTLTYAPGQMTCVKGVPQLMVEDLQKFYKRLRKRGLTFRYYSVGEYGSQTYRPHYHVIFFGHVPEQELNESWGKGLVHVGQVTPASVAYCCKYLINSKSAFMSKGRIPPFSTMSRRPGIGATYLNRDMIEWHKSGLKGYAIRDGKKIHLPRYYRDKIFTQREKWVMNTLGHRESLEQLRKELKRLARYHDNPLDYYEAMRKQMAARIRQKGREKLKI